MRRALEVGRLEGDEKLKVSARIQIEPIGLDHRVEGEIALSKVYAPARGWPVSTGQPAAHAPRTRS